jgi:hypothetical protein
MTTSRDLDPVFRSGRLGDERFVTGEDVSLGKAGHMRTYQIARVAAP